MPLRTDPGQPQLQLYKLGNYDISAVFTNTLYVASAVYVNTLNDTSTWRHPPINMSLVMEIFVLCKYCLDHSLSTNHRKS